jgi:hypothetical protein
VPGGQGALIAVPAPTTIQKKARAEIKTAKPEISRVAQQTAELAQLAQSTSGSNLAPIRTTDILSARRKNRVVSQFDCGKCRIGDASGKLCKGVLP